MPQSTVRKEIKPDEWLDLLRPFDQWNVRALLAVFAAVGVPASLLDLGCGTGAMVEAAAKLGLEAWGVDRIVADGETANDAGGRLVLRRRDLTRPFFLERTFEMVACVEVAEHIPEHYVGVFTNTIGRHTKNGSLVVFTAAPPGQGGNGHVHLKSASYWRDRMHERGLHYREDLSVRVRIAWMTVPMPMFWLPANVQIFQRIEEAEG